MNQKELLQEIREISHGLGDRRPRIDAVTEIRSVLVRQMALLIYQSKQEANKQGSKQILIKHILSVVRNYKLTLVRVLSYYLLKDNIYKFSNIGITSYNPDTVVEENNSIQHEVQDDLNSFEALMQPELENTLNLTSKSIDPLSLLSIDFTKSYEYSAAQLKKSIFKQLIYAITEMKLEIIITEEDIKNATEKRQIRVNNLSLALSTNVYESFQICRKKNFNNEKGNLLLRYVHKYLPPKINYDKQVKEVFKFLAKETIASLIDHVFENRPDTSIELKQSEDEDIPKHKKFKHDDRFKSILVEEIKNVTDTYWKKDFGDIHYPYEKNNTIFFKNQLIFK